MFNNILFPGVVVLIINQLVPLHISFIIYCGEIFYNTFINGYRFVFLCFIKGLYFHPSSLHQLHVLVIIHFSIVHINADDNDDYHIFYYFPYPRRDIYSILYMLLYILLFIIFV